MAKLLNLNTKKQTYLQQYHVVGRHEESVQTCIENPGVSRMHARIRWTGTDWTLQDTSRNGTFVNGKPIPSDVKKPLKKGDKIVFGNLHTDVWELVDASPPVCMLIPVTRDLGEIELHGIMALPSEAAPEVTLYISNEGKWLCESASGIVVLKSGDCVGTSDKIWRFIDAAALHVDTTLTHNTVNHAQAVIKYTFNASQNEEHIGLRFHLGETEVDLGMRQHHYLALVLARKRNEDSEAGIADGEQGWIDKDKFSKMLGLKETLVNIHIYRLRKAIVKSLPENYTIPMAIERRNCEIRFGSNQVEIFGGNVVSSMHA